MARRRGKVFITGNSGFPKSHNISVAIDKATVVVCRACLGSGVECSDEEVPISEGLTYAENHPCPNCDGSGKTKGAEREVVGRRADGRYAYGFQATNNQMGQLNPRESNVEKIGQITAPATPDAATWSGYGTGLKPAWEIVVLCRKPRLTTYAATALEHGSGALNIDAARIRYASAADMATTEAGTERMRGSVRGKPGQGYETDSGWQRPWRQDAEKAAEKGGVFEAKGRWPANFMISHSPGCVRRGERRVKGTPKPYVRGVKAENKGIYGKWEEPAGTPQHNYADADGLETIENWDCVPDCAVALLDATMVDNAGFSWYNKEPVEVNQCCENASIAVTSSLLELLTSSGALGDSVLEDALPIPCESEGSKTPGGNKTSAMGDGIVSGENQGAESSIGNSKADGYGSSPMGQSQTDTTSTMPTVIKRTTTCPTCNAFLHLSITLCTNGNEKITSLGQTALKQDGANDAGNIGRSPSLLSVQRGHIKATVSIASLSINGNGARHTRTTPETTIGVKETQGGKHHSRFFKNFDPPLRFRYSAKASRAERDAGLEEMPEVVAKRTQDGGDDTRGRPTPRNRNPHPTIKPLAVTRYLATLLRPPESYLDDATILIPFCGVASEMIGALLAGWRNVVGIELEAAYVAIAEARLEWWAKAMALTHETEPKDILAAMKGRDIDDPVQAAMFNGALT